MSMRSQLLVAALCCVPALAYAQEAEQPPIENNTNANETPAGTAHDTPEGSGDPTQHFNWASNWLGYKSKDVYGGKLGDGKMIDPHTGQVVMDAHTGRAAEEEPMSPPFVLMLVFGVVGYLLKKCGYPLAPMVLAIVLGDKAEEAFRQSLLASQGGLGIFFSNGLVSTIMGLGLEALFWPLISNLLTRLRPRAAL